MVPDHINHEISLLLVYILNSISLLFKPMSNQETPIDQTLKILRPKWSIELIYQNLLGYKRFSELQQRTGIAKNLLSERLKGLTANGIFKKVRAKNGIKRLEYRLTEKGLALLPVMIALHQWGEQWTPLTSSKSTLIDLDSNSELAPLQPRNAADQVVNLHQIKMVFTQD